MQADGDNNSFCLMSAAHSRWARLRLMIRNDQPFIADRLVQRLQWSDLDPAYLRRLVEMARDEDLSGAGLLRRPSKPGDPTTAGQRLPAAGVADLVARHKMVVCGLGLIPIVFSAYGKGCSAQCRVQDGATVAADSVIATVHGPPRLLLAAERVLLNFLQRLCGISTTAQAHVRALGSGRTRLLDTRKTTPGWRMLEKYAVACGGAWNHRLGLFDRVLIKDNHLAAAGATAGRRLDEAVRRARAASPELPIEVEIDALTQIPSVLAASPDVVLFDNFPRERLRRAVAMIGGRVFTEASGGVNLRTLPRLAGLGLDFVSTGALVHHSVWADIGLDWHE